MTDEKTMADEKSVVNAAISIVIAFGLVVQFSYDVILGMGFPAPISWGEFLVFGIISITLWAAIIAFIKLSAARGSLIFLLAFGLFFLFWWSVQLIGALAVNPSAASYELHVLNRVIGFATTMLLVLYAFYRLTKGLRRGGKGDIAQQLL
ncbi:MAG: hypothetical protein IBX64_01230 [Actinobacteria bacterium]|nr:hypothetical protein [Actinomycetota bacterium]